MPIPNFKNTEDLSEYLAEGDVYHGSFRNMQRQQVREYSADGTIEVWVVENHYTPEYDDDPGFSVEDFFSLEEARERAVPGDRILKVVESVDF